MKWTEKQQQVIDTRDRNILVSAAAGSGKTAVLVERIISMITDAQNPVDIDKLLVVTFTRAAASEMKERIRKALDSLEESYPNDENIKKQLAFIHNADISTIDSFCGRVVKENFDRIDLDPNYRIADEIEVEMLKSDILDEMLEQYYLDAEEAFEILAQQYTTGKANDNIKKLISVLYRHAEGNLYPKKWLMDCKKKYETAAIEDLQNAKWWKELIETIQRNLQQYIKKLEGLKSVSECEDGPKFGSKIDEVQDGLHLIASKNNYEEIRAAIIDTKFPTFRASNRDCDPLKKDIVANVKKEASDYVTDLKKTIFALPLNQIKEDIESTLQTAQLLFDMTIKFMDRLSEEKSRKGIMDFGDQAHFALNILTETDKYGNIVPSETAIEMSKRYHEIMIDEYQDSNYIQEAILSAITKGQGINNMFMVGDVKQSIYRFRQARPQLFIDKYDSYSDEKESDEHRIILDKNFRSRREVINSVNFVFDYIMHREVGGIDYRDGNQLVYGANYSDAAEEQNNHTEMIVVEGDRREIEAGYIAQKIKEITDPETGMKIMTQNGDYRVAEYRDIVILLRKTKGVAEIYLERLSNAGIPAFSETKTGYYNAMEIRFILNILTILDNPKQDIPLVSVLTSPVYRMTEEELATIKIENTKEYFYDSLMVYAENGDSGNIKDKVNCFLKDFYFLRKMTPIVSVHDLITEILQTTNYELYVRALPNGKRRVMNIQILKEKALAYENTSYKGVFNFVRYIEKMKYLDKDEGEALETNENDNIVRIMTIHKGKGLQFPIVFMSDTNDGKAPGIGNIEIGSDGMVGLDTIDINLRTRAITLPKLAISMKNKQEEKAELLRLIYVAMTRAQEKLFITGLAAKPETLLAEFYANKFDNEQVMPCYQLTNCHSIMSIVGNAIGKNKAMDIFFEGRPDYNITDEMYKKDADIEIKVVQEKEIALSEAVHGIDIEISKEQAELLKNFPVDDTILQKLQKQFEYKYPYENDIYLSSKASVTEIKKQNMVHQEETDGNRVFEAGEKRTPEPKFLTGDKMILTGANRGSAYHRFLELIDMSVSDYNMEEIKSQLQLNKNAGMIEEAWADCINCNKILAFTKSELFQRMQKAYKEKQLFREQKFLMGIPAKTITKTKTDETMIVQGIIDVCFIENGKYVIADYKTDNVETMEELKEKYHVQLECYQAALEQITGIEVSEKIIYSIKLNKEISF